MYARRTVTGSHRGLAVLILARRTGEVFYIGDGPNRIKVVVLGVHGNQVRIGIDAPKSVPVHREEIYERIKKELAGEPVPEPNGNK